jgi:hypothetical protein
MSEGGISSEELNFQKKISEPSILRSVTDAREILQQGIPAREGIKRILSEQDIIIFGETHVDETIPQFLIRIVSELKTAGVTSFGVEIPPTPETQAVLDEINQGRLEKVNEIDWSLGFNAPQARSLKAQLISLLVQNGIKIYGFKYWDSSSGFPSYNEESEQKAANIIRQQVAQGKTVVLVGQQHAIDSKARQFRNLYQILKEKTNTKSVVLIGGKRFPFESGSPEDFIKRAAEDLKINEAKLIEAPIKTMESDAVCILPPAEVIPKEIH